MDDAEYLCLLYDEQIMFCKLVVSFIHWSIPGVAGDFLSERFQESDALEQEHRHLTVHLAHVHRHRVVDDCKFVLYFHHELRADEDLDQIFFALYALEGRPVLDM